MADSPQELTPIEKTPLPALSSPKGINIEDIIYCVDVLKLSHSQTGNRLGCSKCNITTRLKSYGYSKDYLAEFKRHDADRYAIRRLRISKHLTDAKLQKSTGYQLIGMDRLTLEAERLIRGESTENIAHIDMVKAKEIVDAENERLLEKYGCQLLTQPDNSG